MIAIGLFSFGTNLLLLTGPYFLLQIYDRIFPSRSEEMLFALLLLVTALYATMAVLDYARGRIGAVIGSQIQTDFDLAVFVAASTKEGSLRHRVEPSDVARIQRFCSSKLVLALFDLPFTPVFLAGIFVLHEILGWVAVLGSLVLVGIAWCNRLTRLSHKERADLEERRASALATEIYRGEETLRTLGMTNVLSARWRRHRANAQAAEAMVSARNAAFCAASRSFRLLLQSALLAAGAWLVLEGALSPGIILAMSVMLGRALAPVEAVIGNWDGFASAWSSWKAIRTFEPEARCAEPVVSGTLAGPAIDALNASGGPSKGHDTVHGVSFQVWPGEIVGIVGPSGAGKSSVARLLTGLWHPSTGLVRVSGRETANYSAEELASRIGYLPQEVVLFEGTVAENIARFDPEADHTAVLAAAVGAGVEEMILRLPDGYETEVGPGGRFLSGGQRQRIALARAFYGNPPLLIFDEPDASLDDGAVTSVIRALGRATARGTAVMVIAHRPATIAACDKLLRLRDGRVDYFGPRLDESHPLLADVS